MIELPTLYDHQEDLRDRTRAALAEHRRVILCAGCGVGKTRIAKWILGAAANRTPNQNQSGRSLFVVQGRPLVRNASESFLEPPELPHGLIMSGEDTAHGYRTQVASIDTMLSWCVEGKTYSPKTTFDMIVMDEAEHHLPKFKTFMAAHDAKRKQLGLHDPFGIGLTASPTGRGLADLYQKIEFGPATTWLIENGFLSPFRYFRGKQGRLDKLVRYGRSFTAKSEDEAMKGLSGDLVRDWKKYGEGRPTVGFFPRRSHARDAMYQLEAAGLRVAYVDCDTGDDDRARIFWELNNHKIDYLCNVNLVGRGTDIPAIAAIQLCVAIGSIKPLIQKVGRGSRVDDGIREDGENVPPKRDCIVIDHGGNIGSPPHGRLGFFEDPRHWTLDNTTKDPGEAGTRPTIDCPKCNATYRGGKCANCGYEPTTRERRGQGLEFDGSELKEVKREEKKKKAVRSAEELMVSALYRAGQRGRTWRQCVGIYKSMCEKQGTPHRVPRTVGVGEERYSMIRFGSDDSNRRVSVLYPFTVNSGKHGGEYLIEETESAGSAF